jgi:putative transcription factor
VHLLSDRKIPLVFKKALMQARMAKKWSQKDLAKAAQLPVHTIQTYENGKAIPNGQVVSKLNRVLGVQLPKIPKKKKKKNEDDD